MASFRLTQEAYAIGIICALFNEKAAVEAMLDEEHEPLYQRPEDTNSYTFGKIGKHNVVVACLPEGYQGKAAAATVAIHMIHSFPIKLGLMVGIGGGVPSQIPDVRLGDVVVSLPVGTHGGVIQYDLGKMESDGFRRKGHLDKPPKALLSAVTSLRAKHERKDPVFPEYVSAISGNRRMASKYGFQGTEHDELFDNDQHVIRDPRADTSPQVFYGTIGSGDLVMKNSEERDRLAADDKIMCFEMEAAGLMNDFPCLVIRGISDYADSRKIDRWQPYAAATAAAYAKELLSAVSVQEVEKLGPARKHLVPFSLKGVPAIDHFVQSDEDMQKLEDFFLGKLSLPIRRKMFVVHGLGGIGKTQICIEFARKHHDQYTAVFWMDGSSEDALRQSFVYIVSLLPTTEISPDLVEAIRYGKASIEVMVQGVLGWLALPSNHGWLHIIDNVDHDYNAKDRDPLSYDLTKYIAQVDHGSILITSRLSTLTVLQSSHQLTEMNARESRSLFELQSGRSTPPAATNGSFEFEKLLRELEGMPLALAQAGAYIRQTNISVREYLEHYDNTWDDLIAEQDQYPLLEYAQRSMLTTWTISYQQVERQSMAAAKLLKLWAYLDPKDIWYELLACAIELQPQIKMPEWLLTLVKNRLTYRGALGLLRKYSLVNNGTDTTSYSMHAVLHSWCRHLACMSDMSEAFPELAVSIVAQMVPDEGNGQDWSLWRRLFPHGQQLLFYLRCGSAWRLSLVPVGLYEKLAKLFEHNKAYDEAAEILERALKETERVSGQDHVSTLEAFVKLARMYFRMGRDRHSESEGLYRRALAGCEEALRLGHTDPIAIYQLMSSVLFGLGRHCIAQRSFEAGEAMFRRAMRICGQRSDVGKQIGLDISRALGASYVEQHKFVEAEEAYQHALEESIEIYDSDHHRTLEISWHLSEIYHKLGRVAESKELAERTAAVFDNKLGMNRDLTLDLMDSRLFLYKRLGKFAEAEVMAKQALDETKKRFGEDHRKTLRAIYQLATCYDGQINKLHEARVLYEQLVLRCTEVFGPDDIITAKIMYCLGVLYCNKLRMLSEAEELFMRVLRTSETLKGPNHEETLSVAYSLGCVYNKQGDRVREVKIRQRVLTACEDTVGIEHERTIKASLLLDLSLQRPHGFFTLSSHTITLDSDWKLIAFCERVDGSWNRSTLSLNNVLENVCGHFSWGRAGNFVATARNVRLKGKGGLLVADL